MSQPPRQAEILDIIRAEGEASVENLASRLGVAPQTVRRDLGRLTRAGQVQRTRGGAVPASGLTNIAYVERQKLNAEAKAAIGRACAARIPNDATVFLNIGTTAEAVAQALLGHRDLLVVTNSLNTANILSANPALDIIVAGGKLRRADGGLLGNLTTQVVDFFKFDYCVISCAGIDAEGDLLDFDLQEVHATQTILRRSRTSFVVADQSKFGRSAPGRIGDIGDIDALFTDAPPAPALTRDWTARGLEICTP